MQRGELAKVGVWHEHIEALALVDVRATVSGHVHQASLLDLPDGLVQGLQVVRDVQVLYTAVGGNLSVGSQAVKREERNEVHDVA